MTSLNTWSGTVSRKDGYTSFVLEVEEHALGAQSALMNGR